MIKANSFNLDWLKNIRNKKRKIDPILCEKMIRALGLLEQLVINDLQFVFKGGTSLILLVKKPQRFSIDLDINTEESKENLINILNKICSEDLFKRFDENKRENRGLPKAHLKFYYDSVIDGRENYILLDVFFDKHSYPKVVKTPIKSFWIDTDNDITKVNTPSLDSILGDKLTVFAPNTTGIKYGTDKSMEMIKQLFDIGRLFDHFEDIEVVAASFKNIAEKELEFRKLTKTIDDVLHDIIETSLIVSHFPGGTKYDSPELKELRDGLKRFKGFPIDITYRADDAILSAAKAAYLAAKIMNKDFTKIEKFSDKIKYEEPEFTDTYKHLKKLKKRKIETHYYWCKMFEQLIIDKES
ncbi:MAG: nucleotidyl transferase AbiEii/AbiGii toxin family protein [Candidatus Cloacimonetes bacterium]|nr:nucleotidyl transferase AbiEii/AbiGii toxin family protein [Candidatus Cloacimonadota bacterium]